MGSKYFPDAEAIPEHSTYVYRVTLKTLAGVLVDATQLTSIRLSLRNSDTDAVVNNRRELSVLNLNGGTLTSGVFAFQLTEDDTAILGNGPGERRVLTIDIRLLGGGRITHDASFLIRNMRDIAASASPSFSASPSPSASMSPSASVSPSA